MIRAVLKLALVTAAAVVACIAAVCVYAAHRMTRSQLDPYDQVKSW